jgi:O-antigen ligase
MGFISTVAGIALTGAIAVAAGIRASSAKRGLRWLWTIPCLLVLILIAALPPQELIQRFAEGEDRIEIWRDSMHVVEKYHWAGCGLGAFETALFRDKTILPTNTLEFAHSDYLQVAGELGLPATGIFAVLSVWVAGRLLSVALRSKRGRNWSYAMGLQGALLTFAIHSIADFNLYLPANAMMLAWLGGLAASPGLDES